MYVSSRYLPPSGPVTLRLGTHWVGSGEPQVVDVSSGLRLSDEQADAVLILSAASQLYSLSPLVNAAALALSSASALQLSAR